MINFAGLPLGQIENVIGAGEEVKEMWDELTSIVKRIKKGENGDSIKKDISDFVEHGIKGLNEILGILPNDSTLLKLIEEGGKVKEYIENGLPGQVIDKVLGFAQKLGIYRIQVSTEAMQAYLKGRNEAAANADSYFDRMDNGPSEGTEVENPIEENGNV